MALVLPTPRESPAAAAFARPTPPGPPTAVAAGLRPAAPLAVVEVGSSVASFVPGVEDFGRLDERFRMAAGTWESLPRYKDYRFAVFQLKTVSKTVHPMAFDFPRADTTRLFFPTVHVHDDKVRPSARFDHSQYAQVAKPPRGPWEGSVKPVAQTVEVARTQGLVAAGEPLVRRLMAGVLPNADVLL